MRKKSDKQPSSGASASAAVLSSFRGGVWAKINFFSAVVEILQSFNVCAPSNLTSYCCLPQLLLTLYLIQGFSLEPSWLSWASSANLSEPACCGDPVSASRQATMPPDRSPGSELRARALSYQPFLQLWICCIVFSSELLAFLFFFLFLTLILWHQIFFTLMASSFVMKFCTYAGSFRGLSL